MQKFVALAFALGASLFFSKSAGAATITLSATAHGHYNSNGDHSQSNFNYLVGQSETTYRNFFVFNLAPLPGAITSATFDAYNPPNGSTTSSSFVLHNVSTPASNLILSHSGATAIYNDLGTGLVFGSHAVSGADSGVFVSVSLNDDAIASLTASLGQFWAIGGELDPLSGCLFGFTSFEPAHLTLQFVPEPPTLTLAALAFIGLAAAAWRKRRVGIGELHRRRVR